MIQVYRTIRSALDKRLQRYALKGNNVHCPCCDSNFITFLPGGVKNVRLNASCPQCGSLERHRLIWKYLKSETNLFNRKVRLLHVAPEPLFYKIFSTYSTIEYVPAAKFGEGYEDKYPTGTKNVDITAIDLPNDSFDAILCSHVLEHIPDDQMAMQELYRVLKPGGWAILQVPLDKSKATTYEDFEITDPKEREQAFGQHDHVRTYGNDYSERLTNAGWQVSRISYPKKYSDQEIIRYGFSKEEDIFYCTK